MKGHVFWNAYPTSWVERLKCTPNIIMSWTFEMHTKHHELNLKHENKTLIWQTFFILIPQALWFPRHWIQQWPRLIEVVIGRSTSHHIQPHWIIKFPQRHWCCRASFMRCQTSHQPSHALFALASIGNLCFYFPPHSGFSHPMHRWQHCCQRCIGWKFHLLLQHQWWRFFFFTHRLWHANRPQRLLWSQNLTHGNQKSALAITTSCY